MNTIKKIILRPRSGKVISRMVYGTIVVTALVLTREAYSESAWHIVTSILSTMIVIAVAESYSGIVGSRLEKRSSLERAERNERLLEGVIIIVASLIPIAIFVFAGFGVVTLATAFTIAPLVALSLLFFYGFAYGIISGKSISRAIGIGLVDASLGLTLILLKMFVH